MWAHRRGRGVDVHHASRRVGKLGRRTHHFSFGSTRDVFPNDLVFPKLQLCRACHCASWGPCCASPAHTLSELHQTIAGHSGWAESSKSRSVSTTRASSAVGSTQMNVPVWPKWPNVNGELRVPVQCGDLSRESRNPAPSRWAVARRNRQNPGQARNCTLVAAACIGGRHRQRCEQIRGEGRQVGHRRHPTVAGGRGTPPHREPTMPNGPKTASVR